MRTTPQVGDIVHDPRDGEYGRVVRYNEKTTYFRTSDGAMRARPTHLIRRGERSEPEVEMPSNVHDLIALAVSQDPLGRTREKLLWDGMMVGLTPEETALAIVGSPLKFKEALRCAS